MMKVKTYAFSCILSISYLSVVLCFHHDSFFECLPKYSNPSIPIEQFTYNRSNPSYSSTFNFYARNSRILAAKDPQPLAIITAADETHVQAAVVCAQPHGIQIRVRSGGHDYEGLSYISDVPFVILDMFNLREIDINIKEGTAWVQAGAILGELYYAIAQKSKVHAFPAGVCPSLGLGGHFSGGGYGNLLRKYGLSVDNIIDADLVGVNGIILDRKAMGEDLFWAIRGGGGGSFGVILSWTIKLVPVPEKVTVFKVVRTIEQGAVDIVHQWQQVATKLPKDIFIRVETIPLALPSQNRTTVKLNFIGQYLGQKATLLPLMSQSFPKLGLNGSDCTEMSWVESTLFWTNIPAGTPTEALLKRTNTSSFFKMKSDYVKTPLSIESIKAIFDMLIDSKTLFMQWNPYGGRMSEISESATPFPHRKGILFKIQYLLIWAEDKDSEHNLNVSRKFYEAMTPYVSKSPREAFLNYRDLDIGNLGGVGEDGVMYGEKYFKGNYERLIKVKHAVDPGNFFFNEQCIPPNPL